jgi:hypothetical protein
LNIDLQLVDLLLKIGDNLLHGHLQHSLKLDALLLMHGNVGLEKSSLAADAISKGLFNFFERERTGADVGERAWSDKSTLGCLDACDRGQLFV